MLKNKPDWWPKNPYPEDIFPMERSEYVKIVPDDKIRTALSGCLGRTFWDIASETIWDRLQQHLEDFEAVCPSWVNRSCIEADSYQKLKAKFKARTRQRDLAVKRGDKAVALLGKANKVIRHALNCDTARDYGNDCDCDCDQVKMEAQQFLDEPKEGE